MNKQSIYDFFITDCQGKEHSMEEYKGKVLLIVNTAIYSDLASCYKELNLLYRKYHDQGFEILDFPCNQFNGQTCLEDEEITKYLEENYHPLFFRSKKVDVNGENASPLFLYLQKKKKFTGFDKGNPNSAVLGCIYVKKGPGWEKDPAIKWNFTKFLINRKGEVKKRFECTAEMNTIDKSIQSILDHQLEEKE